MHFPADRPDPPADRARRWVGARPSYYPPRGLPRLDAEPTPGGEADVGRVQQVEQIEQGVVQGDEAVVVGPGSGPLPAMGYIRHHAFRLGVHYAR